MEQQYEVQYLPAQPALSIRTRTSVGELPDLIGQAYMTIMAYMEELGIQPADMPFVAYYNLDMEDLDVEMGFPVSSPQPDRGEIRAGKIPAGKRVIGMHQGPYAAMEPTYNAMTQWMAEQGYVPTGVAYEYYYNSPNEVPESELLTRIVFLIE